MENCHYKCLMFILQSFKCDKACPYCTAKITKWETEDDHLEKLDTLLSQLKGMRIKDFVLSGNGEPALYPKEDLKHISDTVRKHQHLFENKRMQTGGQLFMTDKFELFHDYTFKITRVSPNALVDQECLRYDYDYTASQNFKSSGVIINHVLLRDNVKNLEKDIGDYTEKFSNIRELNISILNHNTRENGSRNKYTQWIEDKAIHKEEWEEVLDHLSSCFPISSDFDEETERYTFSHEIPLHFYARKGKYGNKDLVLYQGRFIDYKLNNINING